MKPFCTQLLRPRVRWPYRWLAATGAAVLAAGLWIGGSAPVAVHLLPAPWDKLLHLLVFGMLALGIRVALGRRGWVSWMIAVAVVTVAGSLDEWHQLFLPGRSAGLDDLLADFLGAVLGAVLGAALGQPLLRPMSSARAQDGFTPPSDR